MPSVKRSAFLAVALLLAGAPGARADGDPGSDVLPSQPVFYGSALDLKSKPAAQLDAIVKEARQRGYRVNVAVISRLEDMGSVTNLYEDPENYSQFLAGEIACCVTGRLLVVMPGGFGVYYLGHNSAADRKVVDALPAPGKIENLLPAAIDGVRRLAAASSVQLSVPDVKADPHGVDQPITHASAPEIGTPGSSGGGRGVWLYALPAIVLVVAAAALLGRRAIRTRRRGAAGSAGEPAAVDGEHDPVDVVRGG
jgi:hypothetical protein